jgi:hypothetical protein
VPDTLRTIILEDPEYRRETRSIKAQQMMDEIAEIEYLADVAMTAGDVEDDISEEDYYDPRNPRGSKRKRRSVTADKDMLNMRFKAAQLRRDLLNLSVSAEGSEEAAALNIFFVPISREDFERLQVVTVRNGEDTGKGAFSTSEEEAVPGITGPREQRDEETAMYLEHDNGDIEEV